MNMIEYADRDMLALTLAQVLADDLAQALDRQPRVTLCVPGGTTPAPVFDCLCAVDLDWGRVDVMLSDERWVDADDPRSNTRLLRLHLLQNRAAGAHLIAMHMPGCSLETALPDLALGIAPHLPIDVLLLGMGTDMHIASLIPGGDNLACAMAPDAPTLVKMVAPSQPEPRISLSAQVLAGANTVHIVITGADKRAAIARAIEIDDPMQAPVCAVIDHADVHWAA